MGTFYDFVSKRNPTLLRYEHVPGLIRVAQRISDGDIGACMICMPPRYFKSEIFGKLLPAYHLLNHPKHTAALTSHGANLAWEWSEDARTYYQAHGGKLLPGTGAKKLWKTIDRGAMWAYGVGGGFLGRGFDIGIIDDPMDPDQADSVTYQRKFRSWFPSKFLSRREPGARIVLIMQRLGMDDPVEFLLRREIGEGTPAAPLHWHVVICDEIKTDEPLGRWDGPAGLPKTCTLEEDLREPGQVLAPTRFTKDQVVTMQRDAGPWVTSSQRQQRPMSPQGDFWKGTWFRLYDDLPADAYNGGKDWDTAYTEKRTNAASGYVESFRGPGEDGQFPIYIESVDWDWKQFPDLVSWMLDTEGPHYIEAKASGQSAAQTLAKLNVAVEEVGVKGSKLTRATAVQPVVANRRVWVRSSVVEKLLRGEVQGLLRVSAESLSQDGHGLDVNDMFVQALWRHTRLGVRTQRKEGWFT